MLKKSFEPLRQRWRPIWITEFVDDHRSARGLLQQSLRYPRVRINPSRIDRANACARDARNIEPPVLAIGREQLHGVAYTSLK